MSDILDFSLATAEVIPAYSEHPSALLFAQTPSPTCQNVAYDVSGDTAFANASYSADVFHHLTPPSASFAPADRRLSPIHVHTFPRSSKSVPQSAQDDTWNLIPYSVPDVPTTGDPAHVPASPGGLFLCSPTHLKSKRVSQACDHCRRRKLKVFLPGHFNACAYLLYSATAFDLLANVVYARRLLARTRPFLRSIVEPLYALICASDARTILS
jgi:hypothetical protein